MYGKKFVSSNAYLWVATRKIRDVERKIPTDPQHIIEANKKLIKVGNRMKIKASKDDDTYIVTKINAKTFIVQNMKTPSKSGIMNFQADAFTILS